MPLFLLLDVDVVKSHYLHIGIVDSQADHCVLLLKQPIDKASAHGITNSIGELGRNHE